MGKAVALRHVAFEDLGLLEPWLKESGFMIQILDSGFDDLAGFDDADTDLLIVHGGPLGAFYEDRYPSLAFELELVRHRLFACRRTIGTCRVAQLMARALGASVRPTARKEIGFSPLELTATGRRSPSADLAGQPVLLWHGDQFDLPTGLGRLAGTDHCVNQSSMVGGFAFAWQFHLECDLSRIEQWLIGHALELAQAGRYSGDALSGSRAWSRHAARAKCGHEQVAEAVSLARQC